MTARRGTILLAIVALLALSGHTPQAGAILDRGGLWFHGPSPVPGEILATFANDRWLPTCMPVQFSLNTTVDPILDPDGQPATSLATARTALQAALTSWNQIPTSYIDMQMDRTTANPGDPGFDFVNEATFSSDDPIASFVAAYSRAFFVALDWEAFDGEDADGDGDADVSASTATCRDVDGDGDIEIPAGHYAAGTILDSDVVFVPDNYRFADLVQDPAPLFGDGRLDLQGVAAHEFGHSHGLSHSNVVDTHVDGGSAATMMSGSAFFDGALSYRSLHSDDIAWSSYWYPEGTAKAGPAALQRGDFAFEKHYAVIRGEVRDGAGTPIVGAYPYAVGLDGAIVASSVSGTIQVSANPDTLSWRLLPPALGVIDGAYTLPVPRGIYRLGIESEDGLPIAPGGNTFKQWVGSRYGDRVFPEEFWSGPLESAHEIFSGFAWPLLAFGNRSGIDFVLDDAEQLLAVNADPTDSFEVWNTWNGIPPGMLIAVRMPTERLIAEAAGKKLLIKAAVFGVSPLLEEDRASLPLVMITTGEKRADGSVSIDVAHPLVRDEGFPIQGSELTPLHVLSSQSLGSLVTGPLAKSGRDLFVVATFADAEDPRLPGYGPIGAYLKVPTPEDRVGESYASVDGGATFFRIIGDVYFGLVVATK